MRRAPARTMQARRIHGATVLCILLAHAASSAASGSAAEFYENLVSQPSRLARSVQKHGMVRPFSAPSNFTAPKGINAVIPHVHVRDKDQRLCAEGCPAARQLAEGGFCAHALWLPCTIPVVATASRHPICIKRRCYSCFGCCCPCYESSLLHTCLLFGFFA